MQASRALPFFLGQATHMLVSTGTLTGFANAFVFNATFETLSRASRAFVLPFSPSISKYEITSVQAFIAFAFAQTFVP